MTSGEATVARNDRVARHLVSVWNPSYSLDAMDQHLAVLLRWASSYGEGDAAEDDVYVWWGKVRSSNRQAPLENVPAIRAAAIRGAEDEVHLYLTDYRSLYVGDVLGIAEGDLDDPEHMPSYYSTGGLRCDFWFKLGDIRRLVNDDTPIVIEELKKLRNTQYNDRPVSLYGGMVNLPLVVTRDDGVTFFDEAQYERLADDRLWAQVDADAGTGLGATERDLRENRFGDELWLALDVGARTFIATGERLYREHRRDSAFDFAPVLSSFAKAIEVQANAVLRSALRKIPVHERSLNVDGRSVDLAKAGALGLADIVRAVAGEKARNNTLAAALRNGKWFAEGFPAMVDDFRSVRNEATHSARVGRDVATLWRNRLIGVGCTGDFIELARVSVK